MYYLYILYSLSTNKYYVGITTDINKRLVKHNHQVDFNTYTRKGRPWDVQALFLVGQSEATALKLERYIKKQKSRRLIEQLCNDTVTPIGLLAQLVRVPYIRD